MWKHIPASDKDFDLVNRKIQLRRGPAVVGTMSVTPTGNLNRFKVVVKNTDGSINRDTLLSKSKQGWVRDYSTSGLLYGAAIYFWEEKANNLKQLAEKEQKINNTVNQPAAAAGENVKPNTLILVGKNFTKLVDGLRLHFKPYVGNGFQEFDAVVSRHTMCNNPQRPEVIQVHVQKDGVPFTTYSFTERLDSITVADLPAFDKFSCYLVKNYKKVETVTQTKTAPAQPATKTADSCDDNGQYIIWCPTSDRAPTKILKGWKQAKAVACEMSERHGKEFYWARLMGKAVQKVSTSTVVTTL